MTQSRERPPSEWIADCVAIDAAVGVYLSPTFRDDTTNPTFWHWCTGTPNGPRWLAMGTPLHTVHSEYPWHLEASLLCPECGLHGWIRDGKWVSA